MTNYYYSATTNAFYPKILHDDYLAANSWPDDCTEVDDSIYDEFSGTPPDGKMRVAKDGIPSWDDIPPPTYDELVVTANSMKQQYIGMANDYINSKQWPGKAALGRLKGADLDQYNLWLDYLDSVETINTSTAPNIDWPIQPST